MPEFLHVPTSEPSRDAPRRALRRPGTTRTKEAAAAAMRAHVTIVEITYERYVESV